MTKEEGEKDPSVLIYDLPECFMMTWEGHHIIAVEIWHFARTP